MIGSVNAKGLVSLPPVVVDGGDSDVFLSIRSWNDSNNSDIRIRSVYAEFIKAMMVRPELYKQALINSGPGYLVIDPSRVEEPGTNLLEESGSSSKTSQNLTIAASDSSDSGFSFQMDDQGNASKSRETCFRPWIPYTRIGYGMIDWRIPNPRITHAVKDENRGDNSAASLRCPIRTGPNTDYYVDGLYYLLWSNPFRAMKIPNHCTLTRLPSGSTCCCNKAAALMYGQCEMIFPRSANLANWPDQMRICTNREP